MLDGYHLQHHYAKIVCLSYVHVGWIPPSMAPCYVFIVCSTGYSLIGSTFSCHQFCASSWCVARIFNYMSCKIMTAGVTVSVCPVELWQEAVLCLECQAIWGRTVSRSSLSYNFVWWAQIVSHGMCVFCCCFLPFLLSWPAAVVSSLPPSCRVGCEDTEQVKKHHKECAEQFISN